PTRRSSDRAGGVRGHVGAIGAHRLQDRLGLHHGLAAFQRTLTAAERHRLHRGNAEESDGDDHHRDQDLDQADALHAAPAVHSLHWAPPAVFVVLMFPLIITLMSRLFWSSDAVGVHTLSVAPALISPEGRNTMPAAGPLTWRASGAVWATMT